MAEERNYLDLGDLLIAHLIKILPDIAIQHTTDLADTQDTARPTPAIDIYYAGDRPVAGAEIVAGYQEVDQAWVVVVVSGKGDPRPGAVTNTSGKLMARLLEQGVINGAVLSPNHGPLRRILPGPRAVVTRYGWQFTPLLFYTRVLSG